MPKAIAKWTGGGAEWCVANNIMLTFNLIWHNDGACIFYYTYTLLWCLYNFLIINHVSTVTYKYTLITTDITFSWEYLQLLRKSFLSFISNFALNVGHTVMEITCTKISTIKSGVLRMFFILPNCKNFNLETSIKIHDTALMNSFYLYLKICLFNISIHY